MKEHGIEHARFISADVSGDLSNLVQLPCDSFDAMAGRRVLMYLASPANALRRLSSWLRSNALVVFEESDSTMAPARRSPMEAHDTAMEWLRRRLAAEGVNAAMGFELPATLVQAGLKFERVRAEAVIQGQGAQYSPSILLELVHSGWSLLVWRLRPKLTRSHSGWTLKVATSHRCM